MKKIFYYFPIFAVMAFTAWLLLAAKVFAYDAPVFPTCIDPQGSEIISQESTAFNPDGTRGVGNVYYRISDDKIMQCYCDESANGSQTNWWKVSGLSQEELEYFQQEGWNYVQNGSNSGFEDAPYLVKSSSFNCKDCLPIPTITPSVTASPSATPTLTPSLTPTPTAGQSGSVQSSSGSVQSVTAPVPSVQTLAATGNTFEIALALSGSLLSICGGIIVKKILL